MGEVVVLLEVEFNKARKVMYPLFNKRYHNRHYIDQGRESKKATKAKQASDIYITRVAENNPEGGDIFGHWPGKMQFINVKCPIKNLQKRL